MPPRTRSENRATMEAGILRLGRQQLTTHGAAGLSLRAIARELGVVSSAVYRYVPSRDDLLTKLLVQAYSELADTVDETLAAATGDPRARLLTAARAVRSWAIADPARWALLYGSPVPGYAAPAEQTSGPGTRVIAALLTELAAAEAAGGLSDFPRSAPPADLQHIRGEFGLGLSDGALTFGTTLWATLIGATSLEVFGQYGTGTFARPDLLFDVQLDAVLSLAFN